ncbi:hypothetical protein HYW46_01045 [Candidatus Daviesbacteria bacterium]|nr:hypothetical protein [Candidatus Daviesbacteria bacterium]
MEQVFKYLDKNKYLGLVIVLVATFLVYANSLQNGFVIEDDIYIKNWSLTQSLANIPKMFGGDTAPTGNYGIYRPLRGVFYAISYAMWGASNPLIYHTQALLVHLIITGLVFLIALQVFKKPYLATLAGLLFGLHPIHTEPVDYLTANFDAVSYIFFFGSLYFYLKSLKLPKFDINYYLSLALATLGFFYFEMTLTLPFLVLAYDFCFRRKMFKKWEDTLKIYGPYFFAAGVFLFIRIVLLNMTVRGEYLGGSFYLTMLTMVKVIVKYLYLLIFPLNLSINPQIADGIYSWVHPLARMDKILSQSIFNPDILARLGLLGGLFYAAYFFYKKLPMVPFCIFWFFISILPISYIIPQGPIMQERYIYTASFGFVMLLVYLFDYLQHHDFSKNKKRSKEVREILQPALVTLLIITLSFYAFRTFTRNRDWKDSFAVWSTLAKESPQDVIANFYTANLYAQNNMDDLATQYYNKALSVEYKLHEAHFALGKIAFKQGNFDSAATKFYQTLAINPNFTPALEGLDLINKEATAEGKLNKENIWKECTLQQQSEITLIFSCPTTWKMIKTKQGLTLKDTKGEFHIEMSLDSAQGEPNLDEYLAKQTDTYGNLVNQGLANFLNFDAAAVKVWEEPAEEATQPKKTQKKDGGEQTQPEQNLQKLQFFLFKGSNVIKILVYPSNSPLMPKFERLVSSIKEVEKAP